MSIRKPELRQHRRRLAENEPVSAFGIPRASFLVALAAAAFAGGPARAESPLLIFAEGITDQTSRAFELRTKIVWPTWEHELGAIPSQARVSVSLVPPMGLAGRSVPGKIELGRIGTTQEIESVFTHELGHEFLSEKCPAKRAGELFSEALALWLSEDDQRLIAGSSEVARRFVFASASIEFLQPLLEDGPRVSFHDPAPAQALARLIAESRRLRPKGAGSLSEFFSAAVGACELDEKKLRAFLFGVELEARLSKETILIVDGLSGETLRARGATREGSPVASLLKPYLLAAFPASRKTRVSRAATEWNCPTLGPGKKWEWETALARSCNGFFLDAPEPKFQDWLRWREQLHALGFQLPEASEMNLARGIGLVPGVSASAEQLVALFGFLARKDSAIIDALLETPRTGTLAHLPDSPWFAANKIALKSGTLRNRQLEPERGWILAVGARLPDGAPAFVAAIHQEGSSPQLLLARLRAHLQEVVGNAPKPHGAQVQILGLAPRSSLVLKCETLWLHWRGKKTRPELVAGGTLEAIKLKVGEARLCLRGPTIASVRLQNGEIEDRSYWGKVTVQNHDSSIGTEEKLQAGAATSVRRARARAGSELLFETSEESYLTGVLASEFPNGRAETLKALTLVAKFNEQQGWLGPQPRHREHAICDTTHCQVFGPRNADAVARPGARLRDIVHQAVSEKLEASGSHWMPFALGGEQPWSRELEAVKIERLLELPQPLFAIAFGPNGVELRLGKTGEGITRALACEKFRNDLSLPSCPKEAEPTGDGNWKISGLGEGHGEGLDLAGAEALAAQGRDHAAIIRRYFPQARVVREP